MKSKSIFDSAAEAFQHLRDRYFCYRVGFDGDAKYVVARHPEQALGIVARHRGYVAELVEQDGPSLDTDAGADAFVRALDAETRAKLKRALNQRAK